MMRAFRWDLKCIVKCLHKQLAWRLRCYRKINSLLKIVIIIYSTRKIHFSRPISTNSFT